MNTLWKYLQFGYLVVGIIFLVEGFIAFNENKEKAIFMWCFAIFIIIIFFVKRRFRRKIQQRNNQQ